jgi:hypothetical protein
MESQLTALLAPIVERLWKLQDALTPLAGGLGTTAQPMPWQAPDAAPIELPACAFAPGGYLLH